MSILLQVIVRSSSRVVLLSMSESLDFRLKILVFKALRGLAATTVAIEHFRLGSIFDNEFTNSGGLMIDFFRFVWFRYRAQLSRKNI